MKKLYSTLIAFLIISQAFAQQDFRPGYIVQNNDTLKGYVDYRGAVRSAKTTSFKASQNGAGQAYSPDQISAYGFVKENKVYETKTVPATEAQPEQVLFMQALVKGKASIYTYRDDSDRDHYYISQDGANLVELVEQVYTRVDPNTGKRYRVVDKPYLGVIASAFFDCPALTEKRLENVMLRHSSLIKVATEYNQCLGSEQYMQQPQKGTITFSPLLFFSLPSLQTSGEHMYAQSSFRHTGLGVGAGVAMEVSNPNMSEKLSLVAELLYAPYRFEGEIRNMYNTGRTTDYDLSFDLKYVKLPVQLRYTFPKGSIRPYANAGASFSYAVSSERVETRSSKFNNTNYTETREALEGGSFKKHMFGALVGAGLIIPANSNALLLEARYETTEGISNLRSLASSIKSASLMVGYRF